MFTIKRSIECGHLPRLRESPSTRKTVGLYKGYKIKQTTKQGNVVITIYLAKSELDPAVVCILLF